MLKTIIYITLIIPNFLIAQSSKEIIKNDNRNERSNEKKELNSNSQKPKVHPDTQFNRQKELEAAGILIGGKPISPGKDPYGPKTDSIYKEFKKSKSNKEDFEKPKSDSNQITVQQETKDPIIETPNYWKYLSLVLLLLSAVLGYCLLCKKLFLMSKNKKTKYYDQINKLEKIIKDLENENSNLKQEISKLNVQISKNVTNSNSSDIKPEPNEKGSVDPPVKIVLPDKPKILYAQLPRDFMFDKISESNSRDSMYKIYDIINNEACFIFQSDDSSKYSQACDSPSQFLLCTSDQTNKNDGLRNFDMIPGHCEMENGKWKITKKAIITFK
jgi:cell division protein FtsB